MDTSILENLGLSKGEIKVYLTLLEIGSTKVGKIIEKSGMASSAVHNSINGLIEKGLISYIKKGKIKYYQASPPKQILQFIEEKKKKFENILPELESKQISIKEKQEAEIFEGFKGITTMFNLFIEDVKKGEDYYFFATYFKEPEQTEEIQKFFKKYDIERKERGLIVKGLAPKKLKPLFLKRKLLNIRYTNIPIPSGLGIYKNKITIYSWGEKPVGYLVKSKQLAEMFKEYFNSLWKIAKK